VTAVSPRLATGRGRRRPAPIVWMRAPLPQTPSFWRITVITGALALVGLLMVLSASSVSAIGSSGSAWTVFLKQSVWLLIGAGAFWLGARIDYHRWQRSALPLYVVAVVLCGLVLIPGVGIAVDGARRWLGFGDLRMQPSEVAKLALLVVSASVLARRSDALLDPRRTKEWAGPIVAFFAVLAALVFLEPDMDSVVVLAFIALTMLLVAGIPMRIIGALVIPVLGVGLLMAAWEPYRRSRMLALFDPAGHEAAAYQTIQSVMAMGRGGVFGVGLGAGRAKWHYLPNAHTDFIFSIVGEELGLVGTLVVLAAFAGFGVIGFSIARSAPDRFGALMAAGITAWITGQALINLGAVVGVLPVAGITLPFLSAGGSSLVVTMLAAGILANVARLAPTGAPSRGAVPERAVARRRRS